MLSIADNRTTLIPRGNTAIMQLHKTEAGENQREREKGGRGGGGKQREREGERERERERPEKQLPN